MFHSLSQRRIAAFFVACVLAFALITLPSACKRKANQVPTLQGAEKPVDVREKPVGFMYRPDLRGVGQVSPTVITVVAP